MQRERELMWTSEGVRFLCKVYELHCRLQSLMIYNPVAVSCINVHSVFVNGETIHSISPLCKSPAINQKVHFNDQTQTIFG